MKVKKQKLVRCLLSQNEYELFEKIHDKVKTETEYIDGNERVKYDDYETYVYKNYYPYNKTNQLIK
jgi:hypothetical protein